MKKIYKFGIAIFILMMFYELNSSVVYAGHTSTCKATATTGAYQKYEYSSGTRHNVKSYCNDCDGYLYQQPGDCNISSGDCKNEKKCSLCKHSFGYGDHNYENNGYCNGKKCSICSGTTGYTSHSYGSYVNYSDTQHRKKCSRSGCRNQYSYQAHSLSSSYTVTADTHTLVTSCSDCTYSTTGTAQDHTGGTKSCFAKAICMVDTMIILGIIILISQKVCIKKHVAFVLLIQQKVMIGLLQHVQLLNIVDYVGMKMEIH